MPAVLEQISKNTYTKIDLHRRLGLLQECLEEILYHTTVSPEASTAAGIAYAHKVGAPKDVAALSEWGDLVWGFFQSPTMPAVINKLKKESELLPSLVVYFPVQFDAEATKIVSVWCREKIHPLLLLETYVDPSVIGGCAFVSKDTHHDYSIRHAMKDNKGVVSELLASYV